MAEAPTKPRRIRGWMFRFFAVSLGLGAFFLLEAVLWLFDVGSPDPHEDPFIGFRGVRPLFVLDDKTERYEIPLSRQAFFCPESFAANKADNEFSIFCLGGSTVQGRPYAIETSFTTWLELSLKAADPDREWQVVNCGGVSYASYRLVPILEEVFSFDPDLIILCTGHNEFLEARSYSHLKQLPQPLTAAQEWAAATRTFRWLRGRIFGDRPSPDRPVLETETNAVLDFEKGLEKYHRDDAGRRQIIRHFASNVARMVALAGRQEVPLILVSPVYNLRDCPPFKAQHGDGLSSRKVRDCQELWDSARSLYRTDLSAASKTLKRAIAIDPEHAGLRFDLAKCHESLGQYDEAREQFAMAKELDVCPLRMLEPMRDHLLGIAKRTNTPLLDLQRRFAELSRHHTTGDDYLVDHVHPSIEGHQLVASWLFDLLVEQGLVSKPLEFVDRRDQLFDHHFQQLDDLYFLRGRKRLRGLQTWAQGRSMTPAPKIHRRATSEK